MALPTAAAAVRHVHPAAVPDRTVRVEAGHTAVAAEVDHIVAAEADHTAVEVAGRSVAEEDSLVEVGHTAVGAAADNLEAAVRNPAEEDIPEEVVVHIHLAEGDIGLEVAHHNPAAEDRESGLVEEAADNQAAASLWKSLV